MWENELRPMISHDDMFVTESTSLHHSDTSHFLKSLFWIMGLNALFPASAWLTAQMEKGRQGMAILELQGVWVRARMSIPCSEFSDRAVLLHRNACLYLVITWKPGGRVSASGVCMCVLLVLIFHCSLSHIVRQLCLCSLQALSYSVAHARAQDEVNADYVMRCEGQTRALSCLIPAQASTVVPRTPAPRHIHRILKHILHV